MIRLLIVFLIVLGLGAIPLVPALADEPVVSLKAGAGQEAVETNCAACHSLDYIRINGGFLSAEGWKAEVAKMRGPFGAPVEDATAEEILLYLVTQYGAPPKG